MSTPPIITARIKALLDGHGITFDSLFRDPGHPLKDHWTLTIDRDKKEPQLVFSRFIEKRREYAAVHLNRGTDGWSIGVYENKSRDALIALFSPEHAELLMSILGTNSYAPISEDGLVVIIADFLKKLT